MNKLTLVFLLIFLSCSDGTNNTIDEKEPPRELRSEVIVENNVFKVSYNEFLEQANWIEYEVRQITKACDRSGMNWYTEATVHTSDVRSWANQYGTLDVRIELAFSSSSLVLQTGATVPDGYYKFITFPDGSERCFFFENLPTTMNWDEYEITCN